MGSIRSRGGNVKVIYRLSDGEVKVLEEEELCRTPVIRVINRTVQYEQFDGTMSNVQKWNVVERTGGSAVLIYNKDTDMLLLVEQVRPAVLSPSMIGFEVDYPKNCRMLELLAGGFGKDSPVDCARREAMEEAGVDPLILEYVSEFFLSPGISNERIHLFYAEIDNSRIIDTGGGLVEEDENIKCHWMTPELVEIMVMSGDIVDAKTMIGVLWFMRYKR